MHINGRNNSITNESVPLLSTPMSRGIIVSCQKVVMQSLGTVMCSRVSFGHGEKKVYSSWRRVWKKSFHSGDFEKFIFHSGGEYEKITFRSRGENKKYIFHQEVNLKNSCSIQEVNMNKFIFHSVMSMKFIFICLFVLKVFQGLSVSCRLGHGTNYKTIQTEKDTWIVHIPLLTMGYGKCPRTNWQP